VTKAAENDGQSKPFGIVMQEGIGAKYPGKDRSSEDHINIAGEVFKLDQNLFEIKQGEAADSIIATIKTIEAEERVYQERACSVTFTSDSLFKEGVNLILLAQKRDMWLGTYDIDCTIDG